MEKFLVEILVQQLQIAYLYTETGAGGLPQRGAILNGNHREVMCTWIRMVRKYL